jgi:hypothetical protein
MGYGTSQDETLLNFFQATQYQTQEDSNSSTKRYLQTCIRSMIALSLKKKKSVPVTGRGGP